VQFTELLVSNGGRVVAVCLQLRGDVVRDWRHGRLPLADCDPL